MGAVLVRSAFSANIKERRDCSTALFDDRGRMIVQAEHIPVHLGAMPEAVAAVLARDPQPGEVYVINDPFTGGTHLPDITLVSRVPCGLACSRAHHADVGGMEPASLPAGSTDIYQEGLVLPPVRLDRRAADRHPREHAQPGGASRRPQRPARRPPARGTPPRRARRAAWGRKRSRPRWTSSTATPSASYARPSPSSPTVATRRVTRSSRPAGRSWRSASRSRSPGTRSRSTSRGRRPSTRATSTARSPSRAPPPTSSSAASPSRISRRPAVRTRPYASPLRRARSSTRLRPRPSSPETPRRRAASSTSSSPRSARPCRSPPRARGR